jgi:hypothetical protein
MVSVRSLESYITNYYKGLFGSPEEGNFSMDETRTDNILQVTVEENNLLVAPYTEEKVKKVVFQMEYNKTSGPNSFLAELVLPEHLGSWFIKPS